MSGVVSIAAAFQQAFAYEAEGREADAVAVYRSILKAVPKHPGALLRLAEIDVRHGRRHDAKQRLALALAAARRMRLPVADIAVASARIARSEGRLSDAEAALATATAEQPMHPRALLEQGVLAADRGDPAAAQGILSALTRRHPELGSGWLWLALVTEQLGNVAAAREAAATAVTARETSAAAFEHAARLAWRMRDFAAGERFCRDGLARFGDAAGLWHWLGVVQKSTGRTRQAVKSVRRAAALAPDDAGVHVTLGAVLIDALENAAACTVLERALALGARSAEVWDNLGLARRGMGDHRASAVAFAEAVAANPKLTPALANLLHARQQMCDWDGVDAVAPQLVATLDDPGGDPRWPPWIALTMDLRPDQRLAVARRWAAAMLPKVVPRGSAPPRPPRLRIGYLSNDFREHPTGRLMAGIFELHDRSRVEVFAYSFGTHGDDAVRARLRDAVDSWRDLEGLTDREAAARIRHDGIHVLVDRKGLTKGSRIGILGLRPAPLQLHLQGFPGTMGYDGLDGFIADGVVVPPGDEPFFHERVYRLARCYYGNDARRGVAECPPREAVGLPRDALVLACFNQAYKITRDVFAVWLGALRAHPDALLWLLETSPEQQENLARAARAAGVDARRLVFAPLAPQQQHIARLGCADLSLDTLPVNHHTTGVDSLWAGVPLLTCRGDSLAGRVGASLLGDAGLAGLVTESLADYGARLESLMRNRAELRAMREHLVTGRGRLQLFDTAGYARDLEDLLISAYDEASRA